MTSPQPAASTSRSTFTHTERAQGVAYVGPLVGIGIAAAFAWVITLPSHATATWLIPLALLAFGAWWAWGARITVTITPDRARFRAPFVTRTLSRADVTQVTVAADDGMNPSLITWPAAPTSIGGARVMRFNMGGTAVVTVHTGAGAGVQFVARDAQAAQRIADALQR